MLWRAMDWGFCPIVFVGRTPQVRKLAESILSVGRGTALAGLEARGPSPMQTVLAST